MNGNISTQKMFLKITIIIPSYKRPEKVRRAISYWQAYPVSLIIMDGSPQASIRASDFSEVENLNYIHCPDSFEERLQIGASMATTPYAMFLSDDEFVLYPALLDACDVLDNDSQVSAVLGKTLVFSTFKGEMVAGPCYVSASNLEIDSESPLERLRQRLSVPGNIIFYSLARTHVLQLAGQFVAERKYSCQYISEYQVEAIFCYAGNVRVLPRVFWLRSGETAPVSFKGWRRSSLFSEWFDNAANNDEKNHLLEASEKFFRMSNCVSKKIDGEDFIKEIIKFERETVRVNASFLSSLYSTLYKSFQLLPMPLLTFIRNLKLAVRNSAPGGLRSISILIDELEVDGSADAVALLRIQELVERTS